LKEHIQFERALDGGPSDWKRDADERGERGTTSALRQTNGLRARIMNYGGIVTLLETPVRKRTITDIVRGFDPLGGYLANPGPFFGALLGRYADRIGQARFAVTRFLYQLNKNDGENTLDGGPRGFDKRVWTARAPGLGDVLGRRPKLNADHFNPVDAHLIPTGELRPVAGTPFDFRKPAAIGARIDQNDEQLKLRRGFDPNRALNRNGEGLSLAARAEESDGGRPPGLCPETEHFPDSPNQPAFASTELKPGQAFRNTAVFRFLTAAPAPEWG
jgi:galactose mutarotase-like enzyme